MFEEGLPSWTPYALLGIGILLMVLANMGVLR
jgi:hypothetical protein